ncbi:unnamed protein product [[Candida] boidinii]|nr:unnamed protein product [[Candida] boidinii]
MELDVSEDETSCDSETDKSSKKSKTVRFDPIIEVYASFSKTSTLDEIEDNLLAVEYKNVDKFQNDLIF